MTLERPLHLLVRALGEPSPLYEAYEPYEDGWSEDIEAYTGEVPLDAPELGLPDDLADMLRTWCLSRPPEGFDSRPATGQTPRAVMGGALPGRAAQDGEMG